MRVNRSGTIVLGLCMLQILTLSHACAQQGSTPQLRDRAAANGTPADSMAENDASANANSALPSDISGTYHFERDNESIELDVDQNARKGHSTLSGYISRLGDAETDKDTPLTYFFDKSSVDGGQIAFQTRVLHGVWYSFHGTVLRGNAESRDEDGYYLLHGMLLEHHPASGDDKSADETIEQRVVNFKSMGR